MSMTELGKLTDALTYKGSERKQTHRQSTLGGTEHVCNDSAAI